MSLRIEETFELHAPVDRTWVVVEDPIPAGSTILSRGGGHSGTFVDSVSRELLWPGYVERGLDAWRGYFAWLPRGKTYTEYVVRLNGAGRFNLPEPPLVPRAA